TVRLSRVALRGEVPAFSRNRTFGPHGELRAGSHAAVQERCRSLAALRTMARSAEDDARLGARCLSRGARVSVNHVPSVDLYFSISISAAVRITANIWSGECAIR